MKIKMQKSKLDKKQIGQKGENIAFDYLRKHGFNIIDRNWKIELGEIDIAAEKNKITYVIEVKTQYGNQPTTPEDELTPSKIDKLKSLARMYAMSHKDIPPKLTIAAVCIELRYDKIPKIHFYENLLE